MQRHVLVGALLLCVTLAVLAVPAVADVPDARITVDDVTVAPDTPTADAPVTVSVTVANSGGSADPVTVDSIAVVNDGDVLVEATDSGALSPGDDVEVPLTTRFDTPGEHTLTVRIEATDDDDNTVTVTRPVTVVVEQGAPAVEITPEPAVNGTVSEVPATVSNPTEATLRNIVLTVDGQFVEGITDRRVVAALDPGEEANVTFRIRPEASGNIRLDTAVSYVTAAGTAESVDRNRVLEVDPLDTGVSIRVSTAVEDEQEGNQDSLGVDVPGVINDASGDAENEQEDSGDVRITVANVGNAAVTDVVLEPTADNATLAAQPVTDLLGPGEEATVPVTLGRTPVTAYTFEAAYTVAGSRERVSTGLDLGPDLGSVTVTGVDIAVDDETALITGNVGNPGKGAISGIVVSVGEAEEVRPSYPNRDFFVGEVDGDAFAPFEVTATVGENATHVPLEVQYLVGGDVRTDTVRLPVEDVDRETDDSGLSISQISGVAGIALFFSVAVAYFRRR